MLSSPQLSGAITLELTHLLTFLKESELVDIKWGSKGMLCGWSLSKQPKVLQLAVSDEAEAWVINRTKEALSAGDDARAYDILTEIADENRRKH